MVNILLNPSAHLTPESSYSDIDDQSTDTIDLRIDDVSSLTAGGLHSVGTKVIGNITWSISVHKFVTEPNSNYEETEECQSYLGVYAYAKCEKKDNDSWACMALTKFSLRGAGDEETGALREHSFKNIYTSKDRTCGYADFLDWVELMDPINGFVKANTMKLRAKITVLSCTVDSMVSDSIGIKITNWMSTQVTTSWYSDTKIISKFPWRICGRKVKSARNRHDLLSLGISCNWANKSTQWTCRAAVLIKVFCDSKWTELDLITHNFTSAHFTFYPSRFIDYSSLIDKYRNNVEFMAEIHILDIQGYTLSTRNTEETVFVHGDPIAVDKYLLAAHSPFFWSLFFGDNLETRTKRFEIRDEQITLDIFSNFLKIINPHLNASIKKEYLEPILHMCNVYDVPMVREKCEQYLVDSKEYSKCAKLLLAELYNLPMLKDHTLNVFSFADPNKFLQELRVKSDFNELSVELKAAILTRFVDQ